MTASLLVLLALGVAEGEAPSPPQSACDSPVYMVVEGVTLDRARMGQYAKAIADSELYQKLGGYYVTMPRTVEVFEGDVPSDYVNLTVRFPCIENARAFWNSQIYQEKIRPIRLNPSAGEYRVTIYREAPLRADMQGRVGDASFLADFAEHSIPQVDPPVVGPDALQNVARTEGASE